MQTNEVIKYAVTDTAIATLAERFLPLKINGVEDKDGFTAVHEARIMVKGYRVDIEKKRKELKQEALEYGKKVDTEAKRITCLLEPIEDHLIKEEDAYNAAKEAIKNAARLRAEAEARAKAEAEAAALKAQQEAEAARLRAEAEKLAAERRAMEAERRKAEEAAAAERARQKAQQDRIDAERRKVEEERQRLANIEAARQRDLERQRIARQAAESARIETEARIKREAEEKAAREKAEAEKAEAAKIRAEALRPDREKLLVVASIVAGISMPLVSDVAYTTALAITRILDKAAEDILAAINRDLPAVVVVECMPVEKPTAVETDAELAALIG